MENNKPKIKASVGILTLNSANELPKTLQSLSRFEDVYICDGNSTDNTHEIARQYGARITKQKDTDEPNVRITNFGEARTRCLEQGLFDWHVRVDSDEYLSPEVVEEIAAIVEKDGPYQVYKMPRKYIWQGKIITDTITYPNRQMRFFNRKFAPRFEKITHEKLFVTSGTTIGILKNPMYVPMPDTESFFGGQRTLTRALDWDRRQFEAHITPRSWVKATLHTGALLLLYTVREIRVRLVSRGNKFPFSYEWWRYKYQVLSWLLATKIFIAKMFGTTFPPK